MVGGGFNTGATSSPLMSSLIVAVNKFASAPNQVKTTVTNDPTAGMTPDQITDYMSNVGGGMCGNEALGSVIGLGLNVSLIIFGFFTVGYVIMGGLNFKYNKDVDELMASALRAVRPLDRAMVDMKADQKQEQGASGVLTPMGSFGGIENSMNKGSGPAMNREERRIQRRIQDREGK